MAHKTFISYKYSEARDLRDTILKKLGADAIYYRGETSDSPDLTDRTTETIRRNLADMIYGTSVIIVIISPNMCLSRWMEWEIKYALREQPRDGRVSHTNGVVCVVQKDRMAELFYPHDGYAWAKSYSGWSKWKLFDIINKNRDNKIWSAPSYFSQNYIDIVTEDDFLRNPSKYIEEAYSKSQNIEFYDINK